MNVHSIFELFVFTLLLIVSLSSSAATPKKQLSCKERVEICEKKKKVSWRPLCGTDNNSYPNRCALMRARCAKDMTLRVKHRGSCKENQPCWTDLQTTLMKDPTRTEETYLPRCKADGTYFKVQCNKAEGYCWCVTMEGRVVNNTIVHGKKPHCGSDDGKWHGSSSGKGNRKKGCNKTEKSRFFHNLVKTFRTEYNRLNTSAINEDGALLDKLATEWKFNTLDMDKSNVLTKSEYKDLKRLVRKAIKPEKCARKFVQMCDKDHNNLLSKTEWMKCLLANDTSMKFDFTTPSTNTTPSPADVTADNTTDMMSTKLQLMPGLMSGGEQESEVNDCMSERQETLENSPNTSENYIPECTADGKYKRVQCFNSTGYCWCADEETGGPIPGTSVRNVEPKCENISLLARPMKGCSENQKIVYLKDLMDYLVQKHRKNNTSSTSDYGSIISGLFDSLDVNHNKVLERKEWKPFRQEMSRDSKLKQCGKQFPRHCDVNRDNKIDPTEWSNCLNTTRDQIPKQPTDETSTANATSAKRRGPNPIESYLKDDD